MGKKNRHEKQRQAAKAAGTVPAIPARQPEATRPSPAKATRFDLVVDIKSSWHAGSGRGGGYRADALVRRDGGYPFLPGKHLAGLLRSAMTCLEAWGHAPEDATVRLFGPEPGQGAGKGHPSGCVTVRSAVVPQADREALAAEPGAAAALFRISQHTAVDAGTGSARHRHLRSIESVVPMVLVAPVTVEALQPLPADAAAREHEDLRRKDLRALARAAALVHAVGGWRNRGFGRAVLTLEPRP